MKNTFKLVVVSVVVSATVIACDPPKPAAEKTEADSLKTIPDTTQKDTITVKADSVKIDSVKK